MDCHPSVNSQKSGEPHVSRLSAYFHSSTTIRTAGMVFFPLLRLRRPTEVH